MKIAEILANAVHRPKILKKYENSQGQSKNGLPSMMAIHRVKEGWSKKYKKSINCNNPKGFSQKAHCAGRKKKK